MQAAQLDSIESSPSAPTSDLHARDAARSPAAEEQARASRCADVSQKGPGHGVPHRGTAVERNRGQASSPLSTRDAKSRSTARLCAAWTRALRANRDQREEGPPKGGPNPLLSTGRRWAIATCLLMSPSDAQEPATAKTASKRSRVHVFPALENAARQRPASARARGAAC